MICATSSRRQVVYAQLSSVVLNVVVLSMVELEIACIASLGKNQKDMVRKSLLLAKGQYKRS